ncbi:MAG TPA: pitrilysin family protein [Vicinamibacterales bacterium]|jgi:zinc protease|nr:pitrilysin family protein [Vicinamibacterales bacterium]
MPSPATLTAHGTARMVRLDNGLKIIVQEVHTAPLVSVWCWYRVGSGDERPGLTGVSHWVEHMNFKGTRNIPRDDMKGIVERFGGTWNGYTWIDQTTYLETAGKDALDTLLFIEAERMSSGLYEPDECESERTVIISELQGGENDPDQLLDTEVTATAFRQHPYRHPTIGWLDDLRAMSREDLYSYYRTHYVPDNATLVVVGAVDADDVLRRAEGHFGRIPPGPAPARRRPTEPAQIGERRVTLEREGTTAYLKAAWHAPAATDPDFFPMLVLDAALTGAKGTNIWGSFRGAPPQRRSRLYVALVERGLASMVSGALLPTAEPFLYSLSLTAMRDVPLATLESAALEAVDQVRREGLTADEVSRAKRQLKARLVFEVDSVTNLAHQLGYCETTVGPGFFDRLRPCVEAVTADQVADVARRRLGRDTRTVGWFQPVRK